MAKAGKKTGKKPQKFHSDETGAIDVPVFIAGVNYDGEAKVRLVIDESRITLRDVQTKLLGAALEVSLILDTEAGKDIPGQGVLIETELARMEFNAEIHNITMRAKPRGFGLTMKTDVPFGETKALFEFEGKSARAVFFKTGDAGESEEEEEADAPGQQKLETANA